jgi:uncharacterized protein GlcG (DUF336 family)
MIDPASRPRPRSRIATALRATLLSSLLAGLAGCGGPPPEETTAPIDCGSTCAQDVLSAADVERIVAQTVLAAQARGLRATIAVTDRPGNVLAVYAMTGTAPTFRIDGGRGVLGGLEGVAVLPSSLAAISKALTGAYLSSAGNAFSSRTAGQIVQQHFNPREANQPAGPLFGVQFSQLSCSDQMRRDSDAALGPKRSPLGLAADPGGLPLYRNGRLVGGIGVIADGVYGLDLDVLDLDSNADEILAVAGSNGFEAPQAIRASRITADGRSLRYADSNSVGSTASSIVGLPGGLQPVPGYFPGAIRAGTAFGVASSGIRRDSGAFADLGAWILVDGANANRHPPVAGTDGGMSAAEVQQTLRQAFAVANRTRAQIRRPAGQPAQVSIAVVDTNGALLGLVRSPDAPVFGTDVAVQKARSAAFLSNPAAGAELLARADANYPNPPPATASIAAYVPALRGFLARPTALGDGMAYSTRALGNLARPYFPDGIQTGGNGPLSKPFAQWSPFSTGLQLDLSVDAIVAAALGGPGFGCTGLARLPSGLQIFAGGVPIYRTVGGVPQLLGGIGVSGDGTDQDDMIAFLGLSNAAAIVGNGFGQAPAATRVDTLVLPGGQLRYVQCPVAPFLDSAVQNACDGL